MLTEICLTQKDLHMTHEAPRGDTIRIIEKTVATSGCRERGIKTFLFSGYRVSI